jgi:hypothetical protein
MHMPPDHPLMLEEHLEPNFAKVEGDWTEPINHELLVVKP